MAKGDLTRALRQTGGLDPVVATLQDMWNKKAQQDYYNNLLSGYNKYQQKLQTLGQQQLGNPLVANTQQAQQNILKNLNQGNQLPVGVAAPQQQMSQTQQSVTKALNMEQPITIQPHLWNKPGTKSRTINPAPQQNPAQSQNNILKLLQSNSKQLANHVNPLNPNSGVQQQPFNPRSMENYNKVKNEVDQFKQQMFIEALKDGVDPNTALAYSQMLGEYAQRNYAPLQNTWKDISPGAEAVEYDAFGNPTGRTERNAKEKEYGNKETIELTEAKDGYPAGSKVDVLFNKNNPSDYLIVGKAANNQTRTVEVGKDGLYHRIDTKGKDVETGEPVQAPNIKLSWNPIPIIIGSGLGVKSPDVDVAGAQAEIDGLTEQLKNTEPTILGNNYIPKPNPEYSKLQDKLTAAKANLARAQAAQGSGKIKHNLKTDNSKKTAKPKIGY